MQIISRVNFLRRKDKADKGTAQLLSKEELMVLSFSHLRLIIIFSSAFCVFKSNLNLRTLNGSVKWADYRCLCASSPTSRDGSMLKWSLKVCLNIEFSTVCALHQVEVKPNLRTLSSCLRWWWWLYNLSSEWSNHLHLPSFASQAGRLNFFFLICSVKLNCQFNFIQSRCVSSSFRLAGSEPQAITCTCVKWSVLLVCLPSESTWLAAAKLNWAAV